MDFHLIRAFKGIKLYSNMKKRAKVLWKMAIWHYYRKIFRKVMKSFKLQKNLDIKYFWFKRLANRHWVLKEKERLIRDRAERQVKQRFFEEWFEAKIVHENYEHLVSTMVNFAALKIKSRCLKVLSAHRLRIKNLRIALYKLSNKWMQRSFDNWISYIKFRKIKKTLERKAYTHYYNNLLSKTFTNWLPGCIRVREYERYKQMRDACFLFWKKQYFTELVQKRKAVRLLESKIMLKVYFNSLRNRVKLFKRLQIGIRFRKFKLLMAWRLYSATKKFTKQNMAKAIVYDKWKRLRRTIERLKKYAVDSKERRFRNETELEIHEYEKNKRKLKKYFGLLRRFLIIKHVDVLRRNKLLQTMFYNWAETAHFEAVSNRKLSQFKEYKRFKRIHNTFYALKEITMRDSQRNQMIYEAYKLRKLREFFRPWFRYIVYERKKLELKGLKLYKEKLLRTSFYTLHFHLINARRDHNLNKKLDWFLEKKIIKLIKGVLREWKGIVEFEKNSLRNYLQNLDAKQQQIAESFGSSRSQPSNH